VVAVKASASISTSISGSINARTSTIDVAGRISPNVSPCARPMASQALTLWAIGQQPSAALPNTAARGDFRPSLYYDDAPDRDIPTLQ